MENWRDNPNKSNKLRISPMILDIWDNSNETKELEYFLNDSKDLKNLMIPTC